MDGAAFIPIDSSGRWVWKPLQWEVDGPGVAATGDTGGSSARGNNRGPAWARLSGDLQLAGGRSGD